MTPHPRSPLAGLFAAPGRFDFFQAVRLLDRGSNGVTLRVLPNLRFPAGAVAAATPATAADPAELVVPFGGLTGPDGILPQHYTALLLSRPQGPRHVAPRLARPVPPPHPGTAPPGVGEDPLGRRRGPPAGRRPRHRRPGHHRRVRRRRVRHPQLDGPRRGATGRAGVLRRAAQSSAAAAGRGWGRCSASTSAGRCGSSRSPAGGYTWTPTPGPNCPRAASAGRTPGWAPRPSSAGGCGTCRAWCGWWSGRSATRRSPRCCPAAAPASRWPLWPGCTWGWSWTSRCG